MAKLVVFTVALTRGALPPKPRATALGTSASSAAPGRTLNLFLPYAPTGPFSLMVRQARRRLTVTPDLPGDAFILRGPYRPSLATWTAARPARRGPARRAGRRGERMDRYVGLATPRSMHCADMG